MNRNVSLASKLFSSNVIGQLAVLAAISVAASRMEPASFAAYGVVAAGAYLLASFNTFAAELRSPVVDERKAAALTRGGLAIASMLSCLLAFAGIVFHVATQGRDRTGQILLLVAGCGLALGMQQLLNGLILRDQRQELLARSRLAQALSNACLIFSLLLTPMPMWIGLSIAWLVSVAIGVSVLARALVGRLRVMGTPRLNDLRTVRDEVRLQPLANLMASSTAQLPIFVLQYVGATTLVGAWALVSRFLTPVTNTAVSTLQPIYYGQMAHLLRAGQHRDASRHHRTWMRRLGMFGIIVAICYGIVTWWAIPQLGVGWDVARTVTIPAILHFSTLFVCVPLSQTLVLLGRPNVQFFWTAMRLGLCSVPLLASPWVGAGPALTSWAVLSSVTFFTQLALHRRALTQLEAQDADDGGGHEPPASSAP